MREGHSRGGGLEHLDVQVIEQLHVRISKASTMLTMTRSESKQSTHAISASKTDLRNASGKNFTIGQGLFCCRSLH